MIVIFYPNLNKDYYCYYNYAAVKTFVCYIQLE